MTTPASIELDPVLDALAHQLDLYRLDAQAGAALRQAALALAGKLGELRKRGRDHATLPRVQELARGIWNAGYLGQPVRLEDLELANRLKTQNWPGTLGAMLFVPCWQWIEAPRLEDLPDWLWSFYIDWVFVAPCGATAVGAADAHLERLEVLAEAVDRLARRNIGSPCVVAAVEAFERQRGTTAPLRAKGSLKRWAAASASIFAKYLRHPSNDNALPLANPSGGRPLKLGFLAQNWGESPATRARLPWLVGLDPARFEVHLFADRSTGDALENECIKFAEKLQLMPQRADERVDFLRFAELDVLIHGGDLRSGRDLQVALYRLARLQVVTDECPGTTGGPEIDLRLTAAGALPAEFREKLGLLPGSGFAWHTDSAPVILQGPSRAELGLPDEGPVMVSAPHIEHLSPETFRAWAVLLQRNPASSLLLLLPARSDTFTLEQRLSRLRAATGLDSSRFVVSLGDPRACLRHGDVYLDTHPYSAPTSLLAALAAGLPAVAWEGTAHRARFGARILRGLAQPDWVAADEAGYIDRAQRLLSDESLRAATQASLQRHIALQRGLGDVPLASRHFGDVISQAFDLRAGDWQLQKPIEISSSASSSAELASLAEDALARKDAAAAIALAGDWLGCEPESTQARSALGRAHLLGKNADLAVACFRSALRGREHEAQLWIDLGAGQRARKDIGAAIKAYETALRLDPTLIEGWIATSQLLRVCGVEDLAAEALGVARRLNPSDPRLAALGV